MNNSGMFEPDCEKFGLLCKDGNLEAVQAIVEDQNSQSRITASGYATAFNGAILNGQTEIVSLLLSQGIAWSTAHLRNAVGKGQVDILQAFLDNGWKINEPLGSFSPPALDLVVDDERLIRWFLANGADPNARCTVDDTPMTSAILHAPFRLIKLLFENGGDIEKGELLQEVVHRKLPDRLEVAKFLLDRGARVNDIKYQKYPAMYYARAFTNLGTPLHAAVEEGDLELVNLFLDRAADPTIEDSKGMTATARADKMGRTAIAAVLREHTPPKPGMPTNMFTHGRQAHVDIRY